MDGNDGSSTPNGTTASDGIGANQQSVSNALNASSSPYGGAAVSSPSSAFASVGSVSQTSAHGLSSSGTTVAAGHSHSQPQQQQRSHSHTAENVSSSGDGFTDDGYTNRLFNPHTHMHRDETSSAEQKYSEQNYFEQPFHQLHSRHGNEHNVVSSVEQNLSKKTNSFCTINEQSQQSLVQTKKSIFDKNSNSSSAKPFFKQNSGSKETNSDSYKSNTVSKQVQKNIVNNNNKAASAAFITNEIKLFKTNFQRKDTNMVAMQELCTENNYNFDDEELQYGPGIVSKLRCRYLSLALRQSVNKQRPTLDNLRRATSLNNLLDEEEEDIEEVDDIDICHHRNGASNGDGHHEATKITEQNDKNQFNGKFGSTDYASKLKSVRNYGQYNGNFVSNGKSDQKPPVIPYQKSENNRCRQSQRGNDSLKRARSVEALIRYDNNAWRRDQLKDSEEYPSNNPIILEELIVSDHHPTVTAVTNKNCKSGDQITIEDKIQQARERVDTKTPKRLTSFMDETERPPPDLVKQTLLKFEASANRRPRSAIQRYGNGDVAAKVATYRNKLSQDKQSIPTVLYQKPSQPPPLPPPLSPSKKPLIKPRTTSPKPIVNGSALRIANGTVTNGANAAHFNGKGPKIVDLPSIRNNLEKVNGTSTIRVDTATYRNNKLDSPSSPLSPPTRLPPPLPVRSISVETPRSASIESPLLRKLETLAISTPKSTLADPVAEPFEPADSDSDAESIDGAGGCSGSYDVNCSDSDEQSAGTSVNNSNNKNNDNNDNNDNSINDQKKPMKRHISKSALENISKAGTTTNFQFDSVGSQSHANKNYLPVIGSPVSNVVVVGSTSTVLHGKKSNNSEVTSATSQQPPEPSVRQIGIIRPLLAEPKLPVPLARPLPSPPTNAGTITGAVTTTTVVSTVLKKSDDSIGGHLASKSSGDTIKITTSSSFVSTATVVTNSVMLTTATTEPNSGDVFVIDNTDKTLPSPAIRGENLVITNLQTATNGNASSAPLLVTGNNGIVLSPREIQKNLINKEKNGEPIVGSGVFGGGVGSGLMMIQSPVKWSTKKSSSPSLTSPASSAASASASASQQQQQHLQQQTNTMVFNFSNRKDVPDYIENDGLVIRRKRELPKVSHFSFSI